MTQSLVAVSDQHNFSRQILIKKERFTSIILRWPISLNYTFFFSLSYCFKFQMIRRKISKSIWNLSVWAGKRLDLGMFVLNPCYWVSGLFDLAHFRLFSILCLCLMGLFLISVCLDPLFSFFISMSGMMSFGGF